MRNRQIDTIERVLLGLLFLIMLATIGINYHVAHHVLDDDAASEIMLSEVLHREKRLVSDDFYYSTEFFVQNQLIFGFLFNFFDGWANVRFVGTFIIQVLYLASYIYMMSQSGAGRKTVLMSAILIMLPFTVVYGRTILYHCYYVCNFTATYVILGLFFSFFKRPDAAKGSKIFRFILLMVVSFLSCFLYVRQLFLTMIPAAACLFFYLLASHGEDRDPVRLRKWMLLPLLMTGAGAAGMLCNSHFLIPSLNLYPQTDQNLGFLSPADWGPMLGALLIQFGYRVRVKLFSFIGILSLGGLFNCYVLLRQSIEDLKDSQFEDFRAYMLRTMLAVTLLFNLVIFIFGDIPFRLQADYSRYLVPVSIWIIPLLCLQYEAKDRLPFFKKIIWLICGAVFVLNGLVNGKSFLDSGNFGQPYDGISYDNPHLADDLRSAADFIRAHDYRCGYAFAGEANTLTELLNGFPVVSLRRTLDGVWQYANWLTLKSYKEIETDRAFLLVTKDDLELFEKSLEGLDTERIYFDDKGYVIYDISHLDQFREMIREP